MNVNFVGHSLGGACHHVQLLVRPHAVPVVLLVFEWIGNLFQPHHLLVELGAFLQVAHMHGHVIQFGRSLGGSRLRKQQRSWQKQSYRQNESNPSSFHGWASYNRRLHRESEKPGMRVTRSHLPVGDYHDR